MSTREQEWNLVQRLNRAQVEKLAIHGDREHWRTSGQDGFYLRRMRQEIRELVDAMERMESPEKVWHEAADVANFAAMLADRYEQRHQP